MDAYEKIQQSINGDDPFDPPVAHVWTNGGIPRVLVANAGQTLEERVEEVSFEMNGLYPDAVITNSLGLEFTFPEPKSTSGIGEDERPS